MGGINSQWGRNVVWVECGQFLCEGSLVGEEKRDFLVLGRDRERTGFEVACPGRSGDTQDARNAPEPNLLDRGCQSGTRLGELGMNPGRGYRKPTSSLPGWA